MRSSRSVLGFAIAIGPLFLLAAPASALTYQGTVVFTCADSSPQLEQARPSSIVTTRGPGVSSFAST